jgi:alpha-beta hydrolase superfamily lysophospholipase
VPIFKKKIMMKELSFTISDNTEIKGSALEPSGTCRGIIVIVHGIGEHFGRYSNWASRFATGGYAVYGADHPGHGLSGGKRGHILSYRLVDEITDRLISYGKKDFPGAPVVLYGHSLGGGIVLRYLLKRQPEICCAIVTSPWLKLSFEPPKVKVLMAKAVKSIVPSLIQPSGLVVSDISRDPEVVKDYLADPLVHDKISVSLFNEAMSAAEYCLQNSSLLSVPLLLMHGSGDKICSPEGSKLFAADSPNVDLKIWEGGYHELHNDIIKDEVFGYINGWLAK